MAIEVTAFNYPTSYAQNIDEVYDWLNENAAEYFPGGITKDTSSKRIYCYPIEGDSQTGIAIPFYNYSNNVQGYMKTKYDSDQAVVNPNSTSYYDNAYKKAAKTDHGIAILANSGATAYIGRSDNGNICAIMEGSPAYNAGNQWRYVFGDLENSSFCATSPAAATLMAMYTTIRLISNGQTTVLVPMVFPGGSYSTSLFMTPFTQANFMMDLQTVLIDGQEYVYDGLFALKG